MIKSELEGHLATIKATFALEADIKKACETAVATLKAGGKILLCGNGGSAADAQHIAAELTGRYKTERGALAGIALTTDTSALTAIGNDYGYEFVFSRKIGIKTIGLSGRTGGAMNELCELNLVVPSNDTPRIQEMHIMIGHIICQAIDDAF